MATRCDWLVRLVVGLNLLAFGGCNPKKADTKRQAPYAGREVTVRYDAELGLDSAWVTAVRDWEAETGAKVTLEQIGETELPPAPPGSVLVTRVSKLPEHFPGGNAPGPEPIPESLRGDSYIRWQDVLPGLRESACVRRRQPVFVPISVPGMVLGYREDLLSKAGLSPPRTWDEYIALVKSVEKWAPGLIVAEPWHETSRASWFLARSLAYARHPGQLAIYFDLDTLAPRIASPAFERALEESKSVLQGLPDVAKNLKPADCRRALVGGKAALAICPVNDDAEPAGPIESPEGLVLGFAPLPGSQKTFEPGRGVWANLPPEEINHPTLIDWGGQGAGAIYACVLPAKDKLASEASFNLITSLLVATGGSPVPKGLRGLVRQSQLSTPEEFASSEWPSSVIPQLVGASGTALGRDDVVSELPVPGRERYRAALDKGVAEALADAASPRDALKHVAEEWQAITKEVGEDRLRAGYRESLGFPPDTAAK